MRLTLKIGKVLIKLLSGYTVTFSSAKSALINELISENILCLKKNKTSFYWVND
jgi:hypothetical protein